MPYIKQEDRKVFEDFLRSCPIISSPGQLNYIFTMLCRFYIQKPTYTSINDAIGALECVKLELYRRLAVPYENEKVSQNGDIY
jgi:hypothetical protein